jgi:hypothetical protein
MLRALHEKTTGDEDCDGSREGEADSALVLLTRATPGE